MKDTRRTQANNKTPYEKMTDLTRRLVAVPKAEIPAKRKKTKRKPH